MSQLPKGTEYLNDGLYVYFDGYQIWLYSYNGIEILNEVALDPQTYKSLLAYVARLETKLKE